MMEYRRLCTAVLQQGEAPISVLCAALGCTVLQKGRFDRICRPGMAEPAAKVLLCDTEGAPRRPGGIGDLLAGSCAVLLAWAHLSRQKDYARACLAACVVVRAACRRAYAGNKRAMVAPDVLAEVPAAFEALFPANHDARM